MGKAYGESHFVSLVFVEHKCHEQEGQTPCPQGAQVPREKSRSLSRCGTRMVHDYRVSAGQAWPSQGRCLYQRLNGELGHWLLSIPVGLTWRGCWGDGGNETVGLFINALWTYSPRAM